MKTTSSKGIILDVRKWREADLIVQILLANGSSYSFLASNALKSKKRFGGGVLEPSHLIQFSWTEKNEDRKIINEASLLNEFQNIRSSYEHIQTAMAAIKMIRQASKEGLENKDIYHLLGNFLNFMNKDSNLNSYFLHFQVRLLKLLGVLPSFDLASEYLNHSLNENNKISYSKYDLAKIQAFIRSFSEDYFS